MSVEFYDTRDSARAFDDLRRSKFMGHNLHLSFAWDADYIRLQNGIKVKPATMANIIPDLGATIAELDAPTMNFFIARERDPRRNVEAVPVEQILGHSVSPADPEDVPNAPENGPSIDTTDSTFCTSSASDGSEGHDENSPVEDTTNTSPELLAEMSSLLSSLQQQKKKAEPPARPKIDSVQQLARFILEQSQCPR